MSSKVTKRIATFKVVKGKYHAVNKRAHKLARRMGKRSVLTAQEVRQAVKDRNSATYRISAKVYRKVGTDEYGKMVNFR